MIRPYKIADKAALINLLQLNTPKFFSREEQEDFAEYLNLHSGNYFIKEISGVVVACAGINYGFDDGQTARLSWDIIHPNYQGKGIGRELVGFRIEQMKRNSNVKRIVVRTSQFTYQFYEKMGFILKATEKNFWSEGFDLYEMTLDIDYGY